MTSSQTFPTTTTPLSGRTGTIAVTLLFLVNGMLLGGYAGALPSLRDKLGIDANSIAVLLFCAGAAAIASMQIGGRLADAIGARTVTLVALPLLIAGASVTALATTFQVALVGVVLIGLGNGSLDVAMNAIGVQVEAARRRPIMSFFHAMWSVGNFIGAATVLLLATALGMTGGSIVTPLLITLSVIATLALGVLIKITPVAAVVEHKVGGVRTRSRGRPGSSGSWPSVSGSPRARPPTGPPFTSPTLPRSTPRRARSAWSRSVGPWWPSG